MGLGTILQDTKSYIYQSNGLAERTVQTTRRKANTFLDELREKMKLDIPHTHPIFGWAFRHTAWVLNRFSKIAALGNRTPHELITGKSYKGEMVNFGAVIYEKRLHPKKKKGEKVWNPGVFLGKIENDLFIIHHPDGIHTSRSARAVGEPYNSEKVAAVDYFPWEVRTSTLTSRVIPQKKLPQPQGSLALPAVPRGEGSQQEAIENQEHEEDELSTDEEVQGKDMVVEPKPVPVPEVTDATMLHELLPQEREQRKQEDVEASSPRTSGAISSASRPQFEVVGSPSKIPRLRPELPRYGSGNVGRVKMPSDDIILDVEEEVFQEPLSEDEEFFDEEESDQEEELQTKEETEEDDEDEADPEFSEAFQREEFGPPEVSDEALERFDERATKKEITRLVAMGVLQEVTTSSNEDPDLPEV